MGPKCSQDKSELDTGLDIESNIQVTELNY